MNMDFLRNRALGAALVAASLVALVLSGYSSFQSRSYAQCQSVVTEQLIRASSARAEAAEQDRESDRQESAATALLIHDIFAGISTADRLAAYDAYQITLTKINNDRAATAQERAAHPLPEPPSQVC
jgi:ADP-ribosylglycohydrolase